MLSIGKLGHGQADYYLQAVGQGIEDYYTGKGEAPGRWLGTATSELQLSGQVEADALRAVLNGNRPDDSGPLTRSGQGQNRVPGFDLTFSAPKSVSLMFGLDDPDVSRAVRDAHEAAVEAALNYMERHAAMGRRGKGGVISVLGNGFIAAGFRHRTSRAGDPQLHTHVLVANMTKGPDGRWTALDARRLYIHARTGGFLYQAKLRLELTRRLGVEWTPVRNGVAEVDGIPPAVRRAFSRRRAEIENELANRGERSASAAQVAALHTRREKDYAVPAETLAERWREQATELGFDPQTIDQLLNVATIEPLPPETAGAQQQALTSPTGLTQQRSSFTRRDVVQAWAGALAHGGDVEEIEQLADELLGSDDVVVLAHDASSLTSGDVVRRADGRVVAATSEERRYSTPELLALENQVLDAAAAGRATDRGRVEEATATRVLDARPQLSGEQHEMVDRLLRDGDQIAVVVGKAGTGKTYALDAAREGWQADGYQVVGAALARRAALELRDGAGIDSTSIHALLADLRERPGELLNDRTVLVVDEAGMVSTRQLAEIVQHVQTADAKLVLVGDPKQLPEIDAGGTFRSLSIRGNPIQLSENRRQPEQWEQHALELLRAGQAGDALTSYHEHGRLVVTDTADQQRERMVTDWQTARADGRDVIMIALRRADVAELNQRARAYMATTGQLGQQAVVVHGQPIAVGDQVVALHNHTGLGVTNGTQGVVTNVDAEARTITIRERGGREIDLPAHYLDGTTRSGGPTLDYGYALTGHKAQGITVDDALVLGSDALYREWGYVAMSRGRSANRLYLVAGEPEIEDPLRRPDGRRPVERVTNALATSRAQTSATDTVLQARIQRMTMPELEAEVTRLNRQHDAQQRVARRKQALAEREARQGRAARPAAETPAPDLSRGLMAAELQRRQRPARIALLLDPPAYLTRALGPVPERIIERRGWLELASDVESVRERARFTDRRQALPGREDAELRADIRALEQRIQQERAEVHEADRAQQLER
jgi:conjugative relaxase-like TrwC/TraI family protein